tara:strand:- start:13 stop:147 length:135 start_codon:yes stop_codon:yes gene_type:complete
MHDSKSNQLWEMQTPKFILVSVSNEKKASSAINELNGKPGKSEN